MQLIPTKVSSPVLQQLVKGQTAMLTDASGVPAAYVIDSHTFEAMQTRIRLLEGIARGERAIDQGRVHTQAQAKKRLARWLKNP